MDLAQTTAVDDLTAKREALQKLKMQLGNLLFDRKTRLHRLSDHRVANCGRPLLPEFQPMTGVIALIRGIMAPCGLLVSAAPVQTQARGILLQAPSEKRR